MKTLVDELRQAERRLRPRPPGGGPGGPGGPGGGPPPGDEQGGFPGGGLPPGGDQEGFAPGGLPPGEEGFPGGGPPPDGGQGGFAGGGPPPGDRPDFNSDEFRAQFARMRQEQEKVRKTALDGIGEVLTQDQKAAFNKMLGKPFDLAQLRPGPGNAPRGARPGAARGTTRPRARRNGQPPQEVDEPQ